MAGETIFAARSATHGSALAGVTHARISPNTVHRVDQGKAGSPGPADALVTDKEVVVELYGTNYGALLARIGEAAASCLIGTEGAAGADETITVTNVYFAEPIGAIEVPEKDAGGKLTVFGIRGFANFGAGETFANVISAA